LLSQLAGLAAFGAGEAIVIGVDGSLRRIGVVAQVTRPQCYNAGMNRGGAFGG